jgi:hypothetical protein
MVMSKAVSSYYLKVLAVDSINAVERLSSGSQELFFTPYGKFKNFEAKVKVVAKTGTKDEDIDKAKVIIHLHSINSHIGL